MLTMWLRVTNIVVIAQKHYTNKYHSYETADFDMTRLVVESKLTKNMMDAIHTHCDHDPDFSEYPGPVLL
jgi:uncharacterized protein YcgI (DUF1989 family)